MSQAIVYVCNTVVGIVIDKVIRDMTTRPSSKPSLRHPVPIFQT